MFNFQDAHDHSALDMRLDGSEDIYKEQTHLNLVELLFNKPCFIFRAAKLSEISRILSSCVFVFGFLGFRLICTVIGRNQRFVLSN